jgi:hypothetical protein
MFLTLFKPTRVYDFNDSLLLLLTLTIAASTLALLLKVFISI